MGFRRRLKRFACGVATEMHCNAGVASGCDVCDPQGQRGICEFDSAWVHVLLALLAVAGCSTVAISCCKRRTGWQ